MDYRSFDSSNKPPPLGETPSSEKPSQNAGAEKTSSSQGHVWSLKTKLQGLKNKVAEIKKRMEGKQEEENQTAKTIQFQPLSRLKLVLRSQNPEYKKKITKVIENFFKQAEYKDSKIFVDKDKGAIFFGYAGQNLDFFPKLIKERLQENIRTFYPNEYFDLFYFEAEPLPIQKLLEDADHRFESFEPSPFSHHLTPDQSPQKMLDHILNELGAEGLVIGEVHRHLSPKKFIMDHMDQLKKAGVRTLFLEHLQHDCMQDLLDIYFKSPDKEMPTLLKNSLKSLDARYRLYHKDAPHIEKLFMEKYGFSGLVRAAKEAGIRIVGIDTTTSYAAGYESFGGSQGVDRTKALNFVAEDIIKKEKGDGKFVVLIGNTHGWENNGVPGVAQLLKCPFFCIADAEETEKEEVQVNLKNYHEQIKHVDAFLRLKPPQN